MHRYTHHGRAQHAPVEDVPRLKDLENGAVFLVGGFGTINSLMQMRIERQGERIDALDTELGEVVDQLLVNEFEALAVIFILRFTMRGKSVLEAINHRNQRLNYPRVRTLPVVGAFFFNALAVVVEIGLAPLQGLPQLLKVAGQFGNPGIGRRILLFCRGIQPAVFLGIVHVYVDILVRHVLPRFRWD